VVYYIKHKQKMHDSAKKKKKTKDAWMHTNNKKTVAGNQAILAKCHQLIAFTLVFIKSFSLRSFS